MRYYSTSTFHIFLKKELVMFDVETIFTPAYLHVEIDATTADFGPHKFDTSKAGAEDEPIYCDCGCGYWITGIKSGGPPFIRRMPDNCPNNVSRADLKKMSPEQRVKIFFKLKLAESVKAVLCYKFAKMAIDSILNDASHQ